MKISSINTHAHPRAYPRPGAIVVQSMPPHLANSVLPGISDDLPGLNAPRKRRYDAPEPLRSLPEQPAPTSTFSFEPIFDSLLERMQTLSFAESIEKSIGEALNFEAVVYWQIVPSLRVLYAETRALLCPYGSGLPSYCFHSGGPTKILKPQSHPSYLEPIDSQILQSSNSVYLFPVFSPNRTAFGVVELSKNDDIGAEDVEFGEWFIRKVKFLHKFLDRGASLEHLLLDLAKATPKGTFSTSIFPKISEFFNCQSCEVWKFQTDPSQLTRYDREGTQLVPFPKCGLVGQTLQSEKLLNILGGKRPPGFNPLVDGDSESFLAVPFRHSPNELFAFVLRRSNRPIFTPENEKHLQRLLPHVAIRLSGTAPIEVIGPTVATVEHEFLIVLRHIAENIASQVDSSELIRSIMEHGRVLTKAERCTLFLISEARDSLVSYYQSGDDAQISLPVARGVAGYCTAHKRVVLVDDVAASPLFDRTVDRTTGFATRSLLAVPVYNCHGDVIGCTEFVNRTFEVAFTQADARVVAILNLICGLAVENARLLQNVTAASDALRGIAGASAVVLKSPGADASVPQVLKHAKLTVNADRAVCYAAVELSFRKVAVEGGPFLDALPMGLGAVGRAVAGRRPLIENRFATAELDGQDGAPTHSAAFIPLLDARARVVAMLVFVSAKLDFFTGHDIDLLCPYAAFCALAIQNSALDGRLRKLGTATEIEKWMTDDERAAFRIPEALRLTQEEIARVSSLNCFAPDFQGIGHFKELFFFFETFRFLELFAVTAERFFRFLTTVAGRYTDTAYHNWTHACDVTQCIFFMVRHGRVADRYEAWELFCLFAAAICHDTNHQGFNNAYNMRAETPLGILYKDQSVMEIHHIHESIPIIIRDDIRLFAAFDAAQIKKVWSYFIAIILATDMAKHFDLVKQAQEAVDSGEFEMDNQAVRLLGLQLVMKVADISNVSRPFELADAWCDILNKEFFRQGDLEKSTGLGLTSPLNDRQTANKPKSQIGFYNFICLPLYSVVAKLFPALEVQVEAVRENLERWKQLNVN